MLQAVQAMGSRFFYRSAMQITAEQMRAKSGAAPVWAPALASLPGDDAFDTVIQVRPDHTELYCTVTVAPEYSTPGSLVVHLISVLT